MGWRYDMLCHAICDDYSAQKGHIKDRLGKLWHSDAKVIAQNTFLSFHKLINTLNNMCKAQMKNMTAGIINFGKEKQLPPDALTLVTYLSSAPTWSSPSKNPSTLCVVRKVATRWPVLHSIQKWYWGHPGSAGFCYFSSDPHAHLRSPAYLCVPPWAPALPAPEVIQQLLPFSLCLCVCFFNSALGHSSFPAGDLFLHRCLLPNKEIRWQKAVILRVISCYLSHVQIHLMLPSDSLKLNSSL